MPDLDPLAFANLISARRAEMGVEASDLATALGIPVDSLLVWEAGSGVPDPDVVKLVARELRLPRSLVIEAARRTEDAAASEGSPALVLPPVPTDSTFEDGSFEDGAFEESQTIEEAIPVLGPMTTAPPVDPVENDPLSRAADVLISPFRLLMVRIEQRREQNLAPTKTPSYMEDDRQRLTYALRAVFTAGGVIALTLILRWALDRFGSALGDVWETLTSPF